MGFKAYVELREPGKVPQQKGPFTTGDHLKKFMIEALDVRPSALITVIEVMETGIVLNDGPEWLEVQDGRQRHRARRHRKNSRAAWRQP